MIDTHDPKWLRFLSRRIGWLAIPNIALVFVAFQICGFFFVFARGPEGFGELALVPELVGRGEVWRLVSFVAIPLAMSPLFFAVTLWFEYFILNSIEAEWGAFKTTFYVLTSVLLTIIFSFLFDYPVTRITDFTSTLFLAAMLFPDFEIQMYFNNKIIML